MLTESIDELYDKIKTIRPDVVCLYVSGYTAEAIAHHGVLEAGVNFLAKPYFFAGLSAKVPEALESLL